MKISIILFIYLLKRYKLDDETLGSHLKTFIAGKPRIEWSGIKNRRHIIFNRWYIEIKGPEKFFDSNRIPEKVKYVFIVIFPMCLVIFHDAKAAKL